jgi:hypothetical protein
VKLQSRRLAIVVLFGSLIFVAKVFVPSPANKMIVGVQALVLALAALLLKRGGATYVSSVGGALTALWNIALAPFTLFFAVLYGLLVDGFFFLLRVGTSKGKVESPRLIAATTLSTMLVGFASYYVTVLLTSVIPRNLPMEIIILAGGVANGAIAGYFAAIVWNKYLKDIDLGTST